jgi:hypothetical protein
VNLVIDICYLHLPFGQGLYWASTISAVSQRALAIPAASASGDFEASALEDAPPLWTIPFCAITGMPAKLIRAPRVVIETMNLRMMVSPGLAGLAGQAM